MADAYDRLVATGAIASLKRDIVMEASADIYYLAHIRRWFAEKAGADAARTVRLVGELRANDLCSLAIWGKEKGSFDAVEKTAEELLAHIDKYASFDTFPFDLFLIATERGRKWTARYQALVGEL